MENDKKENKPKRKKVILIILAVLLLLAAAGVGAYIVFGEDDESEPNDGVTATVMPGWDTGITDDDSGGSSGGVQIPGYDTAEMNYGDTTLHLSIGNPSANTCDFYATVQLEDGTVLYESELIQPGYGITDIPISVTLERGEYSAMVVYQCVQQNEEHTPLNAAESAFTLIVK